MKLWDANLRNNKKNSFAHRPSCILPSFSKNNSRLLLPKSLWKCASTISFRNVSGLLVIYLFNYDSSVSTFSMFNMQLDVLLSTVFFQINCNSLVSCNVNITKQPPFYSVFWYVLFYKNLIVLYHWDNNFLLYSDILQIRNFINNLNDEEMTTSHLMCTFLWLFYEKKKKMFRRKKKSSLQKGE